MIILWICLALILLLGIVIIIYGIVIYNNLTKKQQIMGEAFMTMDVFLKKRFDLIPVLVSVSQQATTHDLDLLKELTALGAEAMKIKEIEARQEIDGKLEKIMNRYLQGVMIPPNSIGSDHLEKLHQTLLNLEDDISKSRRYYNATVRHYMIYFSRFPNIFIAVLGGFPRGQYFHITDSLERKTTRIPD